MSVHNIMRYEHPDPARLNGVYVIFIFCYK